MIKDWTSKLDVKRILVGIWLQVKLHKVAYNHHSFSDSSAVGVGLSKLGLEVSAEDHSQKHCMKIQTTIPQYQCSG